MLASFKDQYTDLLRDDDENSGDRATLKLCSQYGEQLQKEKDPNTFMRILCELATLVTHHGGTVNDGECIAQCTKHLVRALATSVFATKQARINLGDWILCALDNPSSQHLQMAIHLMMNVFCQKDILLGILSEEFTRRTQLVLSRILFENRRTPIIEHTAYQALSESLRSGDWLSGFDPKEATDFVRAQQVILQDHMIFQRSHDLFPAINERSKPYIAALRVDFASARSVQNKRKTFVNTFLKDLYANVLVIGSSTSYIIDFFVDLSIGCQDIDSTGILKSMVSPAVLQYLHGRDDFVRRFAMGLFAQSGILTQNILAQASIESESRQEDILQWKPDPVDANSELEKHRHSNILEDLMTIQTNKDTYAKEIQLLMADRLLNLVSYNVRAEHDNIAHLREWFISNSNFMACNVMLSDFKNSEKLAHNLRMRGKAFPRVQPRILSRLFWPPFRRDPLNLPPVLRSTIDAWSSQYQRVQPLRKLDWLPTAGSVDIVLELKDRTLEERVSPGQATVIHHFQHHDTLTLDKLSSLTDEDVETLRRHALYWIAKGVLSEIEKDTYKLLEYAQKVIDPAAAVLAIGLYSVLESSEQKTTEELRIYWSFIEGMLTNLGSLPLERIHSMLTMFVPAPNSYTRTIDELRDFMTLMTRENKVCIVSGQYALKS